MARCYPWHKGHSLIEPYAAKPQCDFQMAHILVFRARLCVCMAGCGADIRHLWQEAANARARAYAPYSKFKVGASICTTQGEVFVGCNIENASYGATICAERAAVCAWLSNTKHPAPHILKKVLVVTKGAGSCCGLCLQFLGEFCKAETLFYFCDPENTQCRSTTFSKLVPFAFGVKDLV